MSGPRVPVPLPVPQVVAADRCRIPVNLADFLGTLGDHGDTGFMGTTAADRADPSRWVARLEDEARGAGLPSGHVPMTTVWLVDAAGHIIGMGRLRHRLNDFLAFQGGHIGFYVAPAARCSGNGRALLQGLLILAARLGIDRALLTTDADNRASQGLIEALGGTVESRDVDPRGGREFLRYRVPTAPVQGAP